MNKQNNFRHEFMKNFQFFQTWAGFFSDNSKVEKKKKV